MGWLWGSSNNSNDATSKLDPALRDFLERESPLKFDPTPKETQKAPPPPADPSPIPTPSSQLPTATETERKVPKESLFQDGRYAHLWKNYQPQAEIEAAGKSDQEKLMDVVEAFNERKALISRAALENCAFEQTAVSDCFTHGTWSQQMRMCNKETRALDRCYTMQSKFLKALGYLNSFERPEEMDERIQMHADRLYQRMLDQEKKIEEAKAQGLPEPEFPSLFSSEVRAAVARGDTTFEAATSAQARESSTVPQKVLRLADIKLSEARKKEAQQRLKGLEGQELLIEEQAIIGEIEANRQHGLQLKAAMEEESRNRQERKEKGTETFGDQVKRFWGWR